MSEHSTWLLTVRERGNPATRLDDRHAGPGCGDRWIPAGAPWGGRGIGRRHHRSAPDSRRLPGLGGQPASRSAAVGAFLIVSADTDLTNMSPW